MLKTYFKIAWRSLVKDKQFSLLNVLGLSAGLACTLLIFMWVNDEMSVDKFFDNDASLYRLQERHSNDGSYSYSDESSGRLSEAVKIAVPEVAYAAAVAPPTWFPQYTLSVGDKNIKANVQYAEKDYFHIFSFTLLDGQPSTVLSSSTGIVLSDELATKLFGTTANLMGKPVQFDHDTTFYVSGIFKKVPARSSQQFDFVLSFDYYKTIKTWVTDWNSLGPNNFMLLKPGSSINNVNQKLAGIIQANTGDTSRVAVASRFSDGYLHNINGGHSSTGERMSYIRLFVALAAFILLIACINFMNLSTAKASRRLKEVGIKKVVGARRGQLVFQFLAESVLLSVIAMAIAIGVAALLLPAFNQLTGKDMVLRFDGTLLTAIAGITAITGLLAGSYPALYISGFQPLAILKGKLKTSTAELLSRRGLVVFQFTLSAILIVAVTVIYQQIQFIRNTSLGYNKENVLRFSSEGAIGKNQEAFMAALQRVPGVVDVAYTYHNIVGRKYSDGLDWAGKDPNQNSYFEVFGVSHQFVKTLGMQVLQGRDFSRDYGLDSASIILNESAVKAIGLDNPIGKTVRFHGEPKQIVGVIKDFHFESMHEPIKPAFLYLYKGEGSIIARIQRDRQANTIAAISALYSQYNPGFPFTYGFLDEAYQRQYESESRTAVLSGYFAALAILISCLGLFGLATFTAQKRQKEIGIRKVVGASASRITAMLSMDFLKLVGIALLIAFPLAGWMMQQWLQDYAYKTSIGAPVFLFASGLILLITVLAVGSQAIRAAMGNPVKALRSE